MGWAHGRAQPLGRGVHSLASTSEVLHFGHWCQEREEWRGHRGRPPRPCSAAFLPLLPQQKAPALPQAGAGEPQPPSRGAHGTGPSPGAQLGAAGLGKEAFSFCPEPGNLGGFLSHSLEPLIFSEEIFSVTQRGSGNNTVGSRSALFLREGAQVRRAAPGHRLFPSLWTDRYEGKRLRAAPFVLHPP